jgi:hypothetical protein
MPIFYDIPVEFWWSKCELVFLIQSFKMLQTPRSQQEPDIWNIKRDSVPIEFQPSISSIASTSNSNYRNENVTRKFYKNPYMIGVQSRFRRKFNEKFKSEKKVNPLFLALLLLIILLLTIAVIVLACYSK